MPYNFVKSEKSEAHKIAGVVVGVVTDNEDPDKLGRVKVSLPRIFGDDESNWARVCSFMAGNDRGAFFLPEVDDEVLVAFEHGDINYPYIIGSLWNGKDALPGENSDGTDDIRLIKSRSGHLVVLDDTDGSEKIEIKDKSGESMITFDAAEKKIIIESGQDLEIKADNGKIAISGKEIELKATQSVTVEGNEVSLG